MQCNVAQQFWKSTVDNYAQPVDITLYSATRSPTLRGTLYRIVSVIQHWVLTVLVNNLKLNYLRVI